MIYKLDIKDPAKTPIKWLPKVTALAQPRTFEFTPGLNVLWGANGVGKSTVIKLLARVFHCEQSGQPVMTSTSIGELADQDLSGAEVQHDGQGVRCFDPGNAVGLIAGSFDYDFTVAGLHNTMFKGSAGQTTLFRFDQLIDEIAAGAVPTLERRIKRTSVNDVWQARLDAADRFLAATGAMGPQTVLLDEPDRSLDLAAQHAIWRFLRVYAGDVQFIVASHAVFALNLPEANYIELVPGTLAPAQRAIANLATWVDAPLTKPAAATIKAARARVKARRNRK